MPTEPLADWELELLTCSPVTPSTLNTPKETLAMTNYQLPPVFAAIARGWIEYQGETLDNYDVPRRMTTAIARGDMTTVVALTKLLKAAQRDKDAVQGAFNAWRRNHDDAYLFATAAKDNRGLAYSGGVFFETDMRALGMFPPATARFNISTSTPDDWGMSTPNRYDLADRLSIALRGGENEPFTDETRELYYALSAELPLQVNRYETLSESADKAARIEAFFADLPSRIEPALKAARRAALKAKLRQRATAPYVRPTHDTTAGFAAWLNRRRSVITPATPAELLSLTLPGDSEDTASRNWGIEIEHPDSAGIYEPAEWDRKDDCSLESAGNGGGYSSDAECGEYHSYYCNLDELHELECGDWQRQTGEDCEDAQDDNSDDCNEFVSPVLDTVVSDALLDLCGALDGRNTNDSAGVHVHVNAPEFRDNLKLQAAAVHAWGLIEPIIEPLFQREKTYYAGAIQPHEQLNFIRADKGRNVSGSAHLDRYRTMNISGALSAHGTIEFRAMGPVYDGGYLTRWAHFVRRFVETVATGTPPAEFAKTRTLADVVSLINYSEV